MRRLLAVAAILLVGCGSKGSHPAAAVGSRGELLHTVSRSLPEDPRTQLAEALARDAWRREQRFLDAVDPGHLSRSTRVDAGLATTLSADDLFELGGQLFDLTFTARDGYGGSDLPAFGRVHTGRRGGPDAPRCSACHWRGGPAGAGDAADDALLDGDGDTPESALARNPPALVGAGLVELLAREMTADLSRSRNALYQLAKGSGAVARGPLTAKGVDFGTLAVGPDGTIDATAVRGVEPDLAIRPFGWKGNVPSLRDAVEDALLVHHGEESENLVQQGDPARVGPHGGSDPDGDGVVQEIGEGQVLALTAFLALQEVPVETTPGTPDQVLESARGRELFASIGCAGCHVPSLPLEGTLLHLPDRSGQGAIALDLAQDGAEPRLQRDPVAGTYRVFLYSDLARHDLGPDLAEPRSDRGVPGSRFLTRPLWGVARSGPYLHDGRAPRIEDAILLHGGEARPARDAFAALVEHDRAAVRLFLATLTRAPRLVTR